MHPIWFVVIGLVGIAVYILIVYFVVLAVWSIVEWLTYRIFGERKPKKGGKR